MKVSHALELVPREGLWKLQVYSILAERMGFNNLWVSEHVHIRNCFSALSIIATSTERIGIGPGVTNPYIHHPATIAQFLATLSELAPNRVVCGLAAGDPLDLRKMFIPREKSLSRVRESFEIIRLLLEGASAKHSGNSFSTDDLKLEFNTAGRIPIYLGAQGPNMLRLAGEIADGVLINSSFPDEIASAVKLVKDGMSVRSSSLPKPQVAAHTVFSIDENGDKARKTAVPYVAFVLAGSPSRLLEKYDISQETVLRIKETLARYDWMGLYPLVSKEMLDYFSVSGTPMECNSRYEEIVSHGVDQFVFGAPIGPKTKNSIQLIAKRFLQDTSQKSPQ